MGTSQAGQTKFTFFPRWMFISNRDGVINLQVPTSQQAADIDDNRPMALPCPFFSVLRRLNQHRPWPGLSLPTLLLYSTYLNDIEHECEFRKHDCSMHVGMVVLKAFDDDVRQNSTTIKSTRQEVMESSDVCAASLSLFQSFSLWSRATVITAARGLSDDLEISLLSERGGVA